MFFHERHCCETRCADAEVRYTRPHDQSGHSRVYFLFCFYNNSFILKYLGVRVRWSARGQLSRSRGPSKGRTSEIIPRITHNTLSYFIHTATYLIVVCLLVRNTNESLQIGWNDNFLIFIPMNIQKTLKDLTYRFLSYFHFSTRI